MEVVASPLQRIQNSMMEGREQREYSIQKKEEEVL